MVLRRVVPLPVGGAFLPEAVGRRLGADIRAPEDQPAFDRSAMDGYAFPSSNGMEKMQVLGEIIPGDGREWSVGRGECVRIFTGGRVPAGCDCVLPQEQARRDGAWMTPLTLPARSWIRKRGEDARAGDVLLREGTRLGVGDIAMLASTGVACPAVSPCARVVHVVTGNELVPVSAAPAVGEIRDSNSSLIAALLREAGAALIRQTRAGDSLEALVGQIQSVPRDDWDLLLISGGAGGGDFDFGSRALEGLGFEIHFRILNLRPGKPLIFATRGSQLAFVIPGNPVSHFVTFHVVIRVALEALCGMPDGGRRTDGLDLADPASETVRLPLRAAWDFKTDPRETWCPARVVPVSGRLVAEPLQWQSSGDLRGLSGVNALVRVCSGEAPMAGDGSVECLLLGVRPLVL